MLPALCTLRRDTLLRLNAAAHEKRGQITPSPRESSADEPSDTHYIRRAAPALMPTPSEHELALQRALVTRDAVIAFMMGGHPRLRGRLGVQGGRGLCFVGLRRVFVGGGWTVGFEVGLM